MDFKAYLEKLRALPEKQKKIILWAIVIILGIILAFFWFRATMDRFSNLGEEFGKVQLPDITSNLNIADQNVVQPDEVVRNFYNGTYKQEEEIKTADSNWMYDSEWCAQDTPDIAMSYATIAQSEDTAIVEAHHIYSSGDNVITVLLDFKDGKWIISKIKCFQE